MTLKNVSFTSFLIIIINLFVNAQKLPNKQDKSLLAPLNVKIDGKATEWGDKFQAYNNATEIFYTIANNGDNIYLIIQALDEWTINKIYSGGITFTINKLGKEEYKDAITITYPVWEKEDKFHINTSLKPVIIPGSAESLMRADSFANAANKKMSEQAKFISITGIKEMDTLISIYNMDGIKAAGAFNREMIYTIEFSLSLKKLGIDLNSSEKISYNIKLSPLKKGIDNVTRTETISSDGRIVSNVIFPKSVNLKDPATLMRMYNMLSITDFWGEYKFAK